MKYLTCLLLLLSSYGFAQPQTFNVATSDEVMVTFEHHKASKAASAVIIMMHQSGASLGEFKFTYNWLNELGVHTIAVDLRSGGAMNGVVNQTRMSARKLKKPNGILDAQQDLNAVIQWSKKTYPKLPIWLLGSSNSTILAVIGANQYPQEVEAVMLFSPGEYYDEPAEFVAEALGKLKAPLLVSSAKNEKGTSEQMLSYKTNGEKQLYLPSVGDGEHGAKTLGNNKSDFEEYRKGVESFISSL